MAGLDSMNINLSLKDREQLFKYLDVSHDDSLSYREFCKIWGNQTLSESESLEQNDPPIDIDWITQLTSNAYQGLNKSSSIKRNKQSKNL